MKVIVSVPLAKISTAKLTEMKSREEGSDEEYLDDPIKLIDYEQERVLSEAATKTDKSPEQPTISIDLTDSDVEVEYIGEKNETLILSVKSVKCKPFTVKVVDCDKHPWFYKKYLGGKNSDNNFSAVNDANEFSVRDVVGTIDDIRESHEDDTVTHSTIENKEDNLKMFPVPFSTTTVSPKIKKKIRPVNISSYNQSQASSNMVINKHNDINQRFISPWSEIEFHLKQIKSQCNKMESQCTPIGSQDTMTETQNTKIDLKKNTGLVGMKVLHCDSDLLRKKLHKNKKSKEKKKKKHKDKTEYSSVPYVCIDDNQTKETLKISINTNSSKKKSENKEIESNRLEKNQKYSITNTCTDYSNQEQSNRNQNNNSSKQHYNNLKQEYNNSDQEYNNSKHKQEYNKEEFNNSKQEYSSSKKVHSYSKQEQHTIQQEQNNSKQEQNNSKQEQNNSKQEQNNSKQEQNNSKQEKNKNSKQEQNNTKQDNYKSKQEHNNIKREQSKCKLEQNKSKHEQSKSKHEQSKCKQEQNKYKHNESKCKQEQSKCKQESVFKQDYLNSKNKQEQNKYQVEQSKKHSDNKCKQEQSTCKQQSSNNKCKEEQSHSNHDLSINKHDRNFNKYDHSINKYDHNINNNEHGVNKKELNTRKQDHSMNHGTSKHEYGTSKQEQSINARKLKLADLFSPTFKTEDLERIDQSPKNKKQDDAKTLKEKKDKKKDTNIDRSKPNINSFEIIPSHTDLSGKNNKEKNNSAESKMTKSEGIDISQLLACDLDLHKPLKMARHLMPQQIPQRSKDILDKKLKNKKPKLKKTDAVKTSDRSENYDTSAVEISDRLENNIIKFNKNMATNLLRQCTISKLTPVNDTLKQNLTQSTSLPELQMGEADRNIDKAKLSKSLTSHLSKEKIETPPVARYPGNSQGKLPPVSMPCLPVEAKTETTTNNNNPHVIDANYNATVKQINVDGKVAVIESPNKKSVSKSNISQKNDCDIKVTSTVKPPVPLKKSNGKSTLNRNNDLPAAIVSGVKVNNGNQSTNKDFNYNMHHLNLPPAATYNMQPIDKLAISAEKLEKPIQEQFPNSLRMNPIQTLISNRPDTVKMGQSVTNTYNPLSPSGDSVNQNMQFNINYPSTARPVHIQENMSHRDSVPYKTFSFNRYNPYQNNLHMTPPNVLPPNMPRPNMSSQPNMPRPNMSSQPNMLRPNMSMQPDMPRPNMSSQPNMFRPNMPRPNMLRPNMPPQPNFMPRQMMPPPPMMPPRPNFMPPRPNFMPRANMQRPNMSRPNMPRSNWLPHPNIPPHSNFTLPSPNFMPASRKFIPEPMPPPRPISENTPPKFTEGTKVLGQNIDGVIRTINLPNSFENIAQTTNTVNLSVTSQPSASPINSKQEMLQELTKEMHNVENVKDTSTDATRQGILNLVQTGLKRPLEGFSKPGPLSKKTKEFVINKQPNTPIEEISEKDQRQIIVSPTVGYSPPILPIPTYQKTFELLSKAGLDCNERVRNENSSPGMTNYVGETCVDEKKKVSVVEYQKRVAIPPDISDFEQREIKIKQEEIKIEPEDDFVQNGADLDLGYDSDTTVKL